MKKLFLLVLSVSVSLAIYAQENVIVDANAVPRELSGSFTKIKASGGIDIYLSHGDTEGVAVSASKEKYNDNIKTVVIDGELHIYYKSDNGIGLGRVMGNLDLKVYVSFKTLTKVTGSGACDFWVKDSINVPSFELDLSGACNFKGRISATDMSIDISGASYAKLSGTVVNASIEASGASDLKAFDLITENCTASTSGASSVNITVNGTFKVSASGASSVKYKGTCGVSNSRSSGASSITKKGENI
jgi:type 1 fimbria pilin